MHASQGGLAPASGELRSEVAIICGLAGRWLPKGWVYVVALVSVLLSFLTGLHGFLGLTVPDRDPRLF